MQKCLCSYLTNLRPNYQNLKHLRQARGGSAHVHAALWRAKTENGLELTLNSDELVEHVMEWWAEFVEKAAGEFEINDIC
jgi:hypothetical protein